MKHLPSFCVFLYAATTDISRSAATTPINETSSVFPLYFVAAPRRCEKLLSNLYTFTPLYLYTYKPINLSAYQPINRPLYYQLIALWVLCEAFLGGIIHGLRMPVSGLVVGSCAVTVICLIGWYVPVRGAILRATVVVAVFKMMLSPQAPPMAYVAVFFQGLLGELLFTNRKRYRINCVLLAVLALLESALQRILVLTIVYGNDLWTAFNSFINGLTGQPAGTNYSFIVASAYTLLHVCAGLLVGTWVAALPRRVRDWQQSGTYRINPMAMPADASPVKGKRVRWALLLTWLLFIALYVQSYYKIGKPLLPAHVSLKILLRSFIIVLGWVLVMGPLLRQLLHRWLHKQKGRLQQEVQAVLALLPATKQLAATAWQQAAGKKGAWRIKTWAKMVLAHLLAQRKIIILSAPVQTGKTTSLREFIQQVAAEGILTTVTEGKRMFLNISTGEYFPMEAAADETDTLAVGRFIFSKQQFSKAAAVIREAIAKDGWLIIDEIGPLELRGEGFAAVLAEVLKQREKHILLVVREGLVPQVQQQFGISATVIHSIKELSMHEPQ